MKIKLLTSRVGTGFNQAAGEIVDVPADEAARMVANELATYVDAPSANAVRTADEPPAARTATQPGRRRR